MTQTTIKVPADLRDALKVQAKAQGRTLGEHLQLLAEAEARRLRFQELRLAMNKTPPDDEYRREAGYWQSDAWN